MSGKTAKSEYSILIVLTAVTILSVVYFLDVEKYNQPLPLRTTLSNNLDGILVFYTLCDDLGLDVMRSYDPLLEGIMDKRINVLILADTMLEISDGEIRHLKNWVSSGGVLICSSNEHRLLDYFRNRPYSENIVETTFNLSSDDKFPNTHEKLPLARDVVEVKYGESVFYRGSVVNDPRIEPLFGDEKGIRIGREKIGSGWVILISDSSFMTNGLIGNADNSILAANLAYYSLSLAGGNTLAFDEYHFGYGGRKSRWTAISATLLKTSIGWAIIVAGVAGILFMYLNGRQFGTRYTPDEKRRRTKIEFVESVGNTYRSAGANRVSLGLIYRWFMARCAALVGLPESAAANTIAAKLSVKTGQPQQLFDDVFNNCEKAMASEKLPGKKFRQLINALRSVEREVFYGHRGSR